MNYMKHRHFSALLAVLLLSILTGCGVKKETKPTEIPIEVPKVVESEVPGEPEIPEPIIVTLAVCGDTMSHMPLVNDVRNEELDIYDYSRAMNGAIAHVQSADYAVANLETTFSGGPKYTGYPNFNSPDDLAADLKEIGFDLLLTANNHCMDKGNKGLMRTLDVLDEVGLAHVGTSRTQEEYDKNYEIVDIGGISVAFLGYTYGTNGIPLPKDAPYAVNVFNRDYLTTLSDPNTDKLLTDLEQVKGEKPDLIAVMIHWGVEYQTNPNRFQTELADLLLENGVDLILGGHSHVPQPMEMRTVTHSDGSEKNAFICYSLGNFISCQNDSLTDTTAVLTLKLTKDPMTGMAEVTEYSYVPLLMLDREAGPERFELLDVYEALKAPDLTDAMKQKLEKAVEDCHEIFGAHDAMLMK